MPIRAIANASSLEIQKGFKKISKIQFPQKRLIGPRNYYLIDTKTKTDTLDIRNIKKDQISQYIAASTLSHCFDAWNYFSRGIESLLNGDIGSTIHFVYYSELRAVMSMMATIGIGIFNHRHVYFNTSNVPIFPRSPTHPFAKDLITAWSQSVKYKELLLQSIIINNRTLFEWINASGAVSSGAYVSMVVKNWLDNWSVDLNIHRDQGIRNEASYRPHFEYYEVDVKKGLKNLNIIWSSLEPTNNNRFSELDKYLLRLAFEELFERSTGNSRDHSSYEPFVRTAFENLGEPLSQRLYNFILRKISRQEHFILRKAKKDSVNIRINQKDPFPMICRAILLLRISTGVTEHFLNDCNIDKKILGFWWENISIKLGILKNGHSIIETSELYADIRESFNEINSKANSIIDVRDCIDKYSFETNNIKQFQRSCFWGLGLWNIWAQKKTY